MGTYSADGNFFYNSYYGTINVNGDSWIDMGGPLALVPSANPLPFYNYGTIDFTDGAADDTLLITGDFAGQGYVNVDVSGLHDHRAREQGPRRAPQRGAVEGRLHLHRLLAQGPYPSRVVLRRRQAVRPGPPQEAGRRSPSAPGRRRRLSQPPALPPRRPWVRSIHVA